MSNRIKQYLVITTIVVSALLLLSIPFVGIKITDKRTNCFPHKVWIIDKTEKNFMAGDFVMFHTPSGAVKYVPENKLWIKKILATEGGSVNVTPAAKGETSSVMVNGIKRVLPVAARITVRYANDKKTFIAFANDSLGRPLTVIRQQIIPAGHVFLYSPMERSYDSRYWGLMKKGDLLGKAYPIY